VVVSNWIIFLVFFMFILAISISDVIHVDKIIIVNDIESSIKYIDGRYVIDVGCPNSIICILIILNVMIFVSHEDFVLYNSSMKIIIKYLVISID